MATISTSLFTINGVLSTDKTVIQNLNELCTAAGCWLAFDVNTGLWSVILNKTGNPVASFNDSNILGNINISGSGIDEFYNSVSVEFPHKDLRDGIDYVDLEIPTEDRYPNELDKKLSLRFDLINDPIQAQYLGTIELKQSRLDKIIQFRTDFSKLGLKAGDIIDVTNTMYGYNVKKFRITTIEEEDSLDGTLTLSITALEYDPDVYDTTGLIRKERTKKTGILPKALNEALTASDNADLINKGFTFLAFSFFIRGLTFQAAASPQVLELAAAFTAPYTGSYKATYQINWGSNTNPSPPMGIRKASTAIITRNGIALDLGDWAGTGDNQVQLYEDHIVVGYFECARGDVIRFYLEVDTDFGPSFQQYTVNPATGSIVLYRAIDYNPAPVAAVWISADCYYLGPLPGQTEL